MKRDSYKSFSSKVADSNSPYKPLRVVPKNSPLTPWRPKPREDGLQPAKVVPKDSPLVPYKAGSTGGSSLVAYGTDGEPLDEAREAHSTDPEKEAAAYKNVIARALADPHVLLGQSDGNRSSEKGDCTIVFNVPSIDSSIAPLVPTFEKETALRYMFEVLLTRREVSEKLDSFLTNELPVVLNRTHAVPKSKGLVSYRSGAAQSRDRNVSWYPKGRMAEAELSQYTTQGISARNTCCDKTGLLHPDWYLGFVRDTFVEIDVNHGFIYKPRGRIIFGAKDGCHAELPINLPGLWIIDPSEPLTPNASITYHIATYLRFRDNFEERMETLNEVIEELNIGGYDDYTFVYNIVRKFFGEDDEMATGVIFIWNPEIWSCCYEEMEFGGRGIDTDVFDNISIETSRRFPPARINRVRIVLNDIEILNRDDYNGYPLIYRHPLNLSSDILSQRMSLMTTTDFFIDSHPANYISPRELAADAPWAGPCVFAEMDLGQAWSPKYGNVWKSNDSGRFLDGYHTWCSAFFGWTVYMTDEFGRAELPNTDQFGRLKRIGLEFWVDWFRERGRYISARSKFKSSGENVTWHDLGAIVLPGYLGMTSDFGHGVLFLYWTRPPMQSLERPFNFTRIVSPGGRTRYAFNDPLNRDREHRDWDNVAAYFDPRLRYNRFRVVHAGWTTEGVLISNFTIVRIDNEDEYKLLKAYVDDGNDDPERIHPWFVVWREGSYAFNDEVTHRQDGFGQTYGAELFDPPPGEIIPKPE